MNIPKDLMYTENDEWIRVDGDAGTIGITDYAQDQLSDIVFVEIMVDEGEEVERGDTCAAVESVKAAADIFMPVSGKIIAVNEGLADNPEMVNSDPYGDAWLIKIKLSDSDELNDLMDTAAYEAQERGH